MSAPLVVNTRDGACWTRRTVTAGGIALYAPEAVKTCPEFVMATLEDLAAHGIQGSADALPMPVGPAPQETGPRSFALVGEVEAEDYDDAVYAAEQAYSGMRGQGYKGSISVDTGAGVTEAVLDVAVDEIAAFLRVRLALESAKRGRRELRAELHTAQAHGRTFLEQRNAHAKELLELRPNVAELEAEREKLVRWHAEDDAAMTRQRNLVAELRTRIAELEAGQQPAEGTSYPPALPWAKHMDADDLEGFLADLVDAASGDDDLTTLNAVESAIATWRVIGEAQHAHNTAPGPDTETKTTADPQALRAEDTADLVTLAPAHRAEADYDAAFQRISLELTATREQWSAWQKALKVDLARTTNRGSCTTSHATWRGIHVVIRCWPAEEDVTPQVQKLRTLLAGQREQAAADAPHEGPPHHTYRLGRDLPETGGAQ